LADRTPLEAVVRETSEEVGVELRSDELLGVLPSVYGRTRSVLVTPFVFLLRRPVRIRLNQEVASSFWASLADLSKASASKATVQVKEGTFKVDCYYYDNHVIWGLTYRIINILLDRSPFDDDSP